MGPALAEAAAEPTAAGFAGAAGAAVAAAGRLVHPLVSARATGQRDTLHEVCASEELRAALGAAVGDWLLAAAGAGSRSRSWAARLVEEGGDAVVCPAAPHGKGKGGGAQVLYLPASALEHLGVTPGRSQVRVSKLKQDSPIGDAARVVLTQVHTPNMHKRCHSALRSFFHIPRILGQGEVFGVPLGGLPRRLREIEDDRAARLEGSGTSSSDEEKDAAWNDGLRPGTSPVCCERPQLDPLSGLLFCEMCSFRVQSIEPAPSSSASSRACGFWVNRRTTEVLIQGSCQARGIPYLASHTFCAAPPLLPAALQGPYQRLLGSLAPSVRAWAQEAEPPALPAVLTSGPRGCGKRLLWRSVCERLGLHLLEANCHELAAQGPGALEEALQRLLLRAAESSPALLLLRRLQALALSGPAPSPAALLLLRRRLEAVLGAARGGGRALALLAASCEEPDELGAPLRRAFQLEVALPRPDAAARAAAAAQLGPAFHGGAGRAGRTALDTPPGTVAGLTAGLSLADLRSVCSEVVMCRHLRSGGEEAAPAEAERIERAVKRIQGGTKVAVTLSSKVHWADVGGLQNAKDEVMNCITLPLSQAQMFDGQKVRSGVLLFGPPGTGKTLLAKAVATECRVHFLSVKGPELLSMYIGESERNVRSLFQTARDLQPCVLFFDELDSLAPARGRGSDSGGVMDRVVSQLVTELDAMPATVFLVGATNRPDLLDRSLLRPGRLDRTVYLGIAKEKLPLLQAITRKFDLDESADNAGGAQLNQPLLEAVASLCPANLTGADVAVLCTDAYTIAQKEHLALLQDIAAQLCVSIGTLLAFFESLERDVATEGAGGAVGAPGGCVLAPVLPPTGASPGACALAGPPGLALCRCARAPDVSVLLHRRGAATPAWVTLDARPARQAEAAWAAALAAVGPGCAACAACGDWAARAAARAHAPVRLEPKAGLRVRVAWRHFSEALRRLQPSVPLEDLRRYEQLAAEYQNTKR